MSYITSIGIANPVHKFDQATIAAFMIRAMQLSPDEARKLKALYRATGIETRHTVLSDYGRDDHFEFYENTSNLEPFRSTKERLEIFRQEALTLARTAAYNCIGKIRAFDMSSVTHLIVVSCTGMYAPGLDIDLVKDLKLKSSVERTCINFMGCYAAFNAMKLARTFCQENPSSKVLVVCAELCSIHFQKENTEENWLANSLFADGAAALLVEGRPRPGLNLKQEAFYCDLAFNGERDMAWSVGDMGFEMRLSSYIPDIIRSGIRELTASLLSRISQTLADVSYFAVHPGGKRILEVIEEELGLSRDQNKYAYEVLKRFGNMSSPTVLFVLHELCKTFNGVDHGKRILSFAFGPGLTLESTLFKIENHH